MSLKLIRLQLTTFAVVITCFFNIPSCWSEDGEQGQSQAPSPVDPADYYRPTAMPDRIVLTWADDPATTQAVTWRTSTDVTAGQAKLALAEGGPGFTKDAESWQATSQSLQSNLSTAHYHTVKFSDLEPSKKYAYRVGDGVNWSEWFHFTTASKEPEPFSFIYFGDAQNDVRSMWSRVIREAYGDAPDAKFMLHAGDLINRAESDAEWGEWFGAGDWLNAMLPSVPVPGNHEQAKLPDGTRRLSHHWRKVFALPEHGPKGLEESCYTFLYQGVRFIGLNSNQQQQEQAVWLEQVLSENKTAWVVCTFYHPMYSTGKDRDNKELRELWKPILDRYRVDLVLQGHDHTYGRTGLDTPIVIPTGNSNVTAGANVFDGKTGTIYVVSVSGPKMYSLQPQPMMKRVAEDTQLYQIITVDGQELRYEARTAIGDLYDAFTLRKREGKINELIEQIPEVPERRRMTDRKAAETTKKPNAVKQDVALLNPDLNLLNDEAQDQDDLCIWTHPEEAGMSTIIASDKSANRIFVYDLAGNKLQSIDVPKPGNIDLRQDVRLGDKRLDIVAVNQRDDGEKLVLFRVDAETRELARLDSEDLATGANYGGCLYYSVNDGRLFFFNTTEEAGVSQFEILAEENGEIRLEKVRQLNVGKCEGAVADDQTGVVYIAEEEKGVWKFPAGPEASTTGELIVEVGKHGIQGDVEGVALTEQNDRQYLFLSDQGASQFYIFPLASTQAPLRFRIEGVSETDGIDLLLNPLGKSFSSGLFACHSEGSPCAVTVTRGEKIAELLKSMTP